MLTIINPIKLKPGGGGGGGDPDVEVLAFTHMFPRTNVIL